MSGCGYDDTCPNCDETISCYSDNKPYDYVSGNCIHCGFYYYTTCNQDTLENLNICREEYNDDYDLEGEDKLPPLTKLPPLKDWLKPMQRTNKVQQLINRLIHKIKKL